MNDTMGATMNQTRLDQKRSETMKAAMTPGRASTMQTLTTALRNRRPALIGWLATALLLCLTTTALAAEMVIDGGFPSAVNWALSGTNPPVYGTTQNHGTLPGAGSISQNIINRAGANYIGRASQTVNIASGAIIANKATDIDFWAMHNFTSSASTGTIKIFLRYADASEVEIFSGTLSNSAWTNTITNNTATVFPLTTTQDVNTVIVELQNTTVTKANANLFFDDLTITYTPSAADSLTVSRKTSVSTTAEPGETGVQMEWLKLASNTTGNGSVVLSSVNVTFGAWDLNDPPNPISTAGKFTSVTVAVDNDYNYVNGTLGSATKAWEADNQVVVDLTPIAAANRTVTAGAPKYLWIIYNMTGVAVDFKVTSDVTAIGVVTPDNAPIKGTADWASNYVYVTVGLGCGGCHPNPMVDTSTTPRDPVTGGVQGDHTKHASAQGYVCDLCHLAVPAIPNHRDDFISMTDPIQGAANARYTTTGKTGVQSGAGYVKWPQSVTPVRGNCQNTYCHGGNNTATNYGGPAGSGPQWGSDSVDTCTFCHNSNKTNSGGAANAYPSATSLFRTSAASAGAQNIHALHLTSTLQSIVCADCHTTYGTVTAAGHIDAATIAAPADVPFPAGSKALLNTSSPGYAGYVCSNVYCHGAKMIKLDDSGTFRTPNWSTSNWANFPTSCTAACHGLPPKTGASTTISSHSTVTAGDVTACKNCHDKTATSNGNPPTMDPAFHINGTLEASGCATDTCHGSLASGQIWPNTGPTTADAAGPDHVGAHQLHMQWLAQKVYSETIDTLLTDNGNGTASSKQQTLCQYCHALGDSDHMGATDADVFKTVALAAAAPKMFWNGANETGTLGTFVAAGSTCTNVDCHVQYGTAAAGSEPVATPSWYVAATHTVATSALPTTMNCAACHNNPTSDTKHTVHTGAATNFGKTIDCASCHNSTTAWGTPTGTLPGANHLNGTFNVDGNLTPAPAYGGTFRTSYGSCGTNYCHRSDASPGNNPAQTVYAWNTTGMANCAICHLEAMNTNKHSVHLASNAMPNATNVQECYYCHNSTATSAGWASGANHINGTDNVNFNTTLVNYETATAAVASGTGATTTCSNIKCHSGVTTPQWSVANNCTNLACHGNGSGPLPSAATIIGEHDSHANNDADYTDCANCHAGAGTYTADGPNGGTHMNLAVEVSMSGITYADANGVGGVNYVNGAEATDADNGTCTSTTGCHGAITLTSKWTAGSTLTNGCFDCHGGGLAAAETGNAKPAVDTIPNPVTYTGQYNTTGHGRPNATTYPGSTNLGANFTSYTGTASPGCYTCHSSTAQHSPAASATDPFRLGATYASDTNALCSQAACHPATEAQSHIESIVAMGADWPPATGDYDYKCIDCHDPHGDANYYMVRSHISAPLNTTDVNSGSGTYGTPLQTPANMAAITFNNTTGMAAGSYGITAATADGICEVCHTQTTYWRKDIANEGHYPATRCTTCHKHKDGFKAGCDTCHGGGSTGSTSGTKNMWPDGSTANTANQAGRHVKHMTALAARAFGFATLNDLLNDASANDKQKQLCEYCHQAVTNDADHPAGTLPAEVFPVGYRKMMNNTAAGVADGGTAAAYVVAPTDTCSNVDCHNSKLTTDGTYGWYDAGTSACMMCHSISGTNNPTSGLHAVVPSVTEVQHDDAFGSGGTCESCHTMTGKVNATTGTHVNAALTADGSVGANFTAMGLNAGMYTATANDTGTCSGTGTSCHGNATASLNYRDDWKHQWNSALNYYTTNTTACEGCHGDKTSGLDATVGVLHRAGGLTAHSSGTTYGCTDCHVLENAAYTFTFGTADWDEDAAEVSHHGNGTIEINSNGTTYNQSFNTCDGCHSDDHGDGVHNYVDTSWTIAGLAGPPLSGGTCLGCHGATVNASLGAVTTDAAFPNGGSHAGNFGMAMKHVSGVLSDDHCKVCHNDATQPMNTGSAKRDIIQLKNADTGAVIEITQSQTETTATRNLATVTFCTSCHDANGATSTKFGANALQPFGNGVAVKDVAQYYNNTITGKTHNYTYNVTPQLVKARSPHGKPTTNVMKNETARVNFAADTAPVGCQSCHPSHGGVSTNPVPVISGGAEINSTIVNASMMLTGYSEPGSCWTCHNAAGVKDYYGDKTGGNGANLNWTGVQNSAITYKQRTYWSRHQVNRTTFSVARASARATADTAVNITCSECHNPHGATTWVGVAGSVAYQSFSLRGNWMTSPYLEDRAPTAVGEAATNYAGRTDLGPRTDTTAAYNRPAILGHGYSAAGGTGFGGYYLEENTFGPPAAGYPTGAWTTMSETATNFAGLCANCHATTVGAASGGTLAAMQTYLNSASGGAADWSATAKVHNTVKGWYVATNSIDQVNFTNNPRMRLLNSTFTYAIRVIQSAGSYAPRPEYAWGVNLTNTTKQAYHSFSCSKCHTPHASSVPRLMVSNCLDVGTGTTSRAAKTHTQNAGATQRPAYTYPTWGTSWSGAATGSDVAQHCHNFKKTNTVGGGGWNQLSGW